MLMPPCWLIVICAGGHGKMKSKVGDAVVAFALERGLLR